MKKDSLDISRVDITLYSDDDRLSRTWSRAFESWLSNYKSYGTLRAYREAWGALLLFVKLPPWKIGRAHLVEWVRYMREDRNNSDSTIQLRLSALSSFYDFCCKDYTVINPEGREIPLYDLNPSNGKVLRKKVEPYLKAEYLTKSDLKLFFASINKETVQGSRDYALFLTYILTGRRSAEIRFLKWSDITTDGDVVIYHWSGKNVESKKAELPKSCYDAILDYLGMSKRFQTIGKDDYIFIGVNDNETRLPNIRKEIVPYESHPISAREVGKLIKKYCRLAGIDKPGLCVHGLRHSATVLRRQVGQSLEEVSTFLNHARFSSTQVYLHQIEVPRDRGIKKVEKLLDL